MMQTRRNLESSWVWSATPIHQELIELDENLFQSQLWLWSLSQSRATARNLHRRKNYPKGKSQREDHRHSLSNVSSKKAAKAFEVHSEFRQRRKDLSRSETHFCLI